MKRIIFLAALMIACSGAFAQFHLGGGVTMGTEMGIDDDLSTKIGFGVNVRGVYDITEKFGATAGFTYFFPSAPTGIDLSAWQINADAMYNFIAQDAFTVYALAGINYSHMDVEGFGDGEIGVDVGAGVKLDFGGFAEVKYDTAFEQVAVTVGFLFPLKK